MIRCLTMLLVLVALAGCASPRSATTRTAREQDSMLANSKVPGAPAVKRAMTVGDSAASHARQLDSAATQP